MAEKKPIVNYSGQLKELQPGDYLPNGNIDGGSAASVYLTDQVITGGDASGN